MKTITIFIFSIILNGCGGAKEASSQEASAAENPDAMVKENPEVTADTKQEKSLLIEYSAITRGASTHIKIADRAIEYSESRKNKEATKQCSDVEWAKLKLLIYKIDLGNLPKLEAPSKKHQTDGALAASLTISKDEKVYQTASFDHGNPPKEIESLVKYILSIAETVD